MMPKPVARLDDDEIEAQRQARDGLAVWKRAAIHQSVCGGPHARALAVVDRLLWQAEAATSAPADLYDHERGGRTRVDRHEIEFVATDMDVPGQDGPTSFRESRRDELFGRITRPLGRRPRRVAGSVRHTGIVAVGTYRPLMGDAPADSRGRRQLQRGEIECVEHRVVGHDRHELTGEQLVRLARGGRVRQQVKLELVAGQCPL